MPRHIAPGLAPLLPATAGVMPGATESLRLGRRGPSVGSQARASGASAPSRRSLQELLGIIGPNNIETTNNIATTSKVATAPCSKGMVFLRLKTTGCKEATVTGDGSKRRLQRTSTRGRLARTGSASRARRSLSLRPTRHSRLAPAAPR